MSLATPGGSIPDTPPVRYWQAAPCGIAPGVLTEGPLWDPATGELHWVDITAGHIHSGTLRYDTSGRSDITRHATRTLPEPVGAVVPDGQGGLIAAAGLSLTRLGGNGEQCRVATVPVPEDGVARRMNDAACDPAGRLLAGTKADAPAAAALYRLDRDARVHILLEGITISNGLGWSPDGTTLYYADSPTRRVDAFDYDLATGALSHRRTFAEFDTGEPDGLTVDAAGRVWVAAWGAGQVRAYEPDGRLAGIVEVPASQVSSCVFAGPDLDTLVITTASEGLNAHTRRAEPHAGRLFTCRTGAIGLPPNVFR